MSADGDSDCSSSSEDIYLKAFNQPESSNHREEGVLIADKSAENAMIVSTSNNVYVTDGNVEMNISTPPLLSLISTESLMTNDESEEEEDDNKKKVNPTTDDDKPKTNKENKKKKINSKYIFSFNNVSFNFLIFPIKFIRVGPKNEKPKYPADKFYKIKFFVYAPPDFDISNDSKFVIRISFDVNWINVVQEDLETQ